MIKGLDTPVSLRANTSSSDSPGQVFAMWLVLGIAALSMLLGCGAKAPVPQEQEPPASLARVVTLEKPNEYLVALKWNANVPADRWAIHRSDSETKANLVELGVLKAHDDSFEDRSVEPGHTYTYFVSGIHDGQMTIRAQTEVTIPKDFVVEGVRADILEITGINRLFLARDSRLLSGERGLTIRANRILSDSGTIETFPSDQSAEFPARGRNAGPVTIEAEYAEGRLFVLNRGEGGATGAPGCPGANGDAGARGRDGDFKVNSEELIRRGFFAEWQLRGRKEWALNLTRDPNHPEWKSKFGGIPIYVCSPPPEDGGQGTPGQPGTDGGAGTDGGNSAPVFIRIANDSPVYIDVSNEPGSAGPGGTGGVGGTGGPGGAPGALDLPRLCSPGRVGPTGPAGASGKGGLPGRAGRREPVCTIVGSHVSEGCRHFTSKGN